MAKKKQSSKKTRTTNEVSKKVDTNFINFLWTQGFSFVGNKITDCWAIRISNNTMYEVHKTNKMAFAYKNKISQMVAKEWFYIVDQDWNEIDSKRMKDDLDKLYNFLGWKYNLDLVVADFFDQAFCAWQIFSISSKINWLWLAPEDWRLKILDSRGMEIEPDKYGTPIKYNYKTLWGAETFTKDTLVDYIAYRDIDIKYQWLSVYNSIIMDAITNYEASRTQMYFFKNNAQPNLFIMLNPDAFKWEAWPDKKKEFDRQWEEKYWGTMNAWKMHSSHLIQDIKTLDISNVDLDLINLRKENDQSFSVIFMLDSRLIWLWKETGSYWEVESTTIRQGNEQIDSYGRMFSDFINQNYKKFVNPEFEYEFRCWNSEFKNINTDKEIALKEVLWWVIMPNEYREKFWYKKADDEGMDSFRTPTANTNINK